MSRKKLTFGDRLRIFRKDVVGISQRQLAKKTNMTPAAICQIESNKRKPSFDSLLSISKALDVSIDELVGKSPISTPPAAL